MISSASTLCFLGDSITDGIGTTKRYFEYLTDLTGAKTHGFGVSGAKTIDLFPQMDEMERTVGRAFDILFVFIGTNDYMSDVPLGSFFTKREAPVPCDSDSDGHFTKYGIRKKREFVFDDHTFCGRLNLVLAELKKRYSDKRVIFMTPLHRAYAYFGGTNIQPDELYANRCGQYLDAYIAAMRQAADIWSVELIDLYRESGLFPLFDDNAKRFLCNSEHDRLHPNAAGHERIAQTILRHL